MYTLEFGPAAYRIFKKLPLGMQKEIYARARILKENPLMGESLQGKHRHLRSLHFGYQGTAYRIVYQIVSNRQLIYIRLADKRENIYKRLEEMGI